MQHQTIANISYEPGCCATISRSLRRTLVHFRIIPQDGVISVNSQLINKVRKKVRSMGIT
jgi:hypothetical protein